VPARQTTVASSVTETAPQNIIVVQNWFEDLKRLVPVK